MCGFLCKHLGSYVKLTLHTGFVKIGSSSYETYQQIALGMVIPLGGKVLLTTVLKLGELVIRRHTAKNCLSLPYYAP